MVKKPKVSLLRRLLNRLQGYDTRCYCGGRLPDHAGHSTIGCAEDTIVFATIWDTDSFGQRGGRLIDRERR